MHFLALFPFACVVTAFVLSMLCIFAGSKAGFMEDTALLTLNSSMLGEFAFNTTAFNTTSPSSATNSSGGLLGDIEGHLHHLGSEIENDIENDIENALKDAAHDIAEAIQVHDFYSVHILDYCQGYYEPGPLVNSTNPSPWENVTQCSNQTGFFTFHPGDIIQSQLLSGLNLSFLHWPSEIEEAVDGVEAAMKAMFVLYCIGVAFAGLALIAAVITFIMGGAIGAVINCMLDVLAFLALCIASAIATVAIDKIVGAINQYGSEIGLAAYHGNKFLAMTWAATALMGVAAVAWIVDCCFGRRHKVERVRNGKTSRV